MIEELTIRGFKSYRSEQKIRFTRGVNKISGRNASGKTTILEAILFGLFGDVPGVDRRDLVPVDGGALHVYLVFRTPKGLRIRIHREATLTRKGDEEAFKTTHLLLEIEGEKEVITRERDAHDRLRELLGISSGTFFNVVYARQKEFVDILNPDRNRMNAILGLTAPTEIREELKDVRRLLEQRGEVSRKGELEERVRNAEASLKDDGARFETERARGKHLSADLEVKRREYRSAKDLVDAAEAFSENFKRLERSRNEYELSHRQLEARGEELQMLSDEVGDSPEQRREDLVIRRNTSEATEERLRKLVDEELSLERRSLDSDIGRLSHQLSEHGELEQKGLTICPKCGQRIDFSLIEKEISIWRQELGIKKNSLKAVEQEIKDIQAQVRIAREKRLEVEKELSLYSERLRQLESLRKVVRNLEEQCDRLSVKLESESSQLLEAASREMGRTLTSLEQAEKAVSEKVKSLQDSARNIYAEVRSAESLLGESDRLSRELEARIKVSQTTLSESRQKLLRISEYEAKIRVADLISDRYAVYERDLRENTLKLLEYQTFEYFRRLTDQQLYSSCHIDRDRYTLEVQPKGSPRSLPAWRAGGGHESLFALAERLALLKVRSFPYLLILDEPTDAVDSENVPHLLEYIARSSREIGQVLLVTHHGQGEEEGVNLIRVRKEDGESKITQEGSTNI